LLAPRIPLLAYANPATAVLDQTDQAENLVAALRACQRGFVELDFSGVEGVSIAFNEQFFRLAEDGLAEIWLTPRHYNASCNRLVKRLLSRLQQQREQAWRVACQRFCAGGNPPADGSHES